MKVTRNNTIVIMSFYVEGISLEVTLKPDRKGVVESHYRVFNTDSKMHIGKEIKDNARDVIIKIFKDTKQYDAIKRATEFLIQEHIASKKDEDTK